MCETPVIAEPKTHTQSEVTALLIKNRRGLQRTVAEQAERIALLEQQIALNVSMDHPVVLSIMSAIESRFPLEPAHE